MNNEHISLRLYVAGDSPNSRQAVANIKALCREHLPNRHSLDIVDVFEEPGRALEDGVFLTPMLLVLSFDPPRGIVGTLSEPAVVLRTLGLGPGAA